MNQSPLTLSLLLSCFSRICLESFSTLASKVLIHSSFALSSARCPVWSIFVLEAFGPSLVLGDSASEVSFEL